MSSIFCFWTTLLIRTSSASLYLSHVAYWLEQAEIEIASARRIREIMRRMSRERPHGEDQLEEATHQPGNYGRMIRPDGTEQWWVRSPKGTWIALRHQRVMPNEDGSITLLSLEI